MGCERVVFRLGMGNCAAIAPEEVVFRLGMGNCAAIASPEECQQKSVEYVRGLAQGNHLKALPDLQTRVVGFGKTEADVRTMLYYIAHVAPIIIHIHTDDVIKFLGKDTHYRNLFETKNGGGNRDLSKRIQWEKKLFPNVYENAQDFARPKYGVQNVCNDPCGVAGCGQYGDSYLVLKNVRSRCTLGPKDSAGLSAQALGVPEYCAHILQKYSDSQLKEVIRVAQGGGPGDSSKVFEKLGSYQEAQIHGEIHLREHIERIVVGDENRNCPEAVELQSIAATCGWKLTYMNDMRRELESKEGQGVIAQEWREQPQICWARTSLGSSTDCRMFATTGTVSQVTPLACQQRCSAYPNTVHTYCRNTATRSSKM